MNTQTQEALHKALKVLNCLNNDRVYETAWVKGAINACEEALATNEDSLLVQPAQEPKCSKNPDAPHGFCRDASHSAGRYVCECEGWEAEQPAQEPYGYWVEYGEEKDFDMAFRYPDKDDYYPSDIKSVTKLYTNPAPSCDKVSRLEVIDNNGRSYVNWGVDKMEFSYQDDGKTLKIFTNGSGAKPSWQGLSDDEIFSLCTYIDHDLLEEAFYRGARAAEQALKEKNT